MLQGFREHIKGWVAGVIFTMIAATFVLWGVQYYLQSRSNQGKAVATVNGQPIMLADVMQQLQRFQMQKGFISNPDLKQQLKLEITQQRINRVLQAQVAKKMGLMASSSQLNPALLQKLQYQPKLYQQVMMGLAFQQIPSSIAASAFVTPFDLAQADRIIAAHSHIGYVVIPVKQFSVAARPSDQQVQAYYKKYQRQFVSPEKIKMQYLVLSPTKVKQSIRVSDEQMQAYYQSNIQNYTQPKSWKVQRLLVSLPPEASQRVVQLQTQKLKAAMAKHTGLEALVKAHPDWRVLEQTVSGFQVQGGLFDVLSNLKVGQRSAPFITTEGINVFKLLDYQPAKVKSFKSVSAGIKKTLMTQLISQHLNDLNQKLSDLTYTHPTSLQQAAKALHLSVQTSDWITADKGKGLFDDSQLRALAFSADVLRQGNNSKPVTLKNGDTLVIRLARRHASQNKPLREVKPVIVKALQLQAAKHQAGQLALSVQAALQKGRSGSAVAGAHHLVWHQYTNTGAASEALLQIGLIKQYQLPNNHLDAIKITDPSVPPMPVLRAVFQADTTQSLALGFTELANGDYVIAQRLTHNAAALKVSLHSQQAKIVQQLERFNSVLYYDSFIAGLRKAANIQLHTKVLQASL